MAALSRALVPVRLSTPEVANADARVPAAVPEVNEPHVDQFVPSELVSQTWEVKPLAVRPQPSLLTQARRTLDCPVVAIGGITVDNAPGLIAAGADALAVITDLFSAPDVRLRAAEFRQLFVRTPASATPLTHPPP